MFSNDIIPERCCFNNTISFSIAKFNLAVDLESSANWEQCPSLLFSFIDSVRGSNITRLRFKWIEDDDFCDEKITTRFYSQLRKKWLDSFHDGTDQIFYPIANNIWTVLFSADRGNALGIGPKCYFFDIFRGALDLGYIRLSMSSNFLVLHAAAIIVSGNCFLFLAISGGGKTTLSQNAINLGYKVLSDDRVFVIKGTDAYYAYGTPFGKFGMNIGPYPIAGVFIIEQSVQNYVNPVTSVDVFEEVWFIEYERRRRCFGNLPASGFFSQFMDFLKYHPTFCLKFKKDFDDWDYLVKIVESYK